MSGARQLDEAPRASLNALLRCPLCNLELVKSGAQWSCGVHSQPEIGQIPWLFRYPEVKLSEWRFHTKLQLDRLERSVAQMKKEQALENLLPTSKKRLGRLLQGYQEHRLNIQKLLRPLGDFEDDVLRDAEAWAHKLPLTQVLTSYFENLHRDWGQVDGDYENNLVRDLIVPLLDTRPGQKVLTLGAGACRLSYDIHQALPGATSIAADINPLLLFAAKKILAGRNLSLCEFPLHPLEVEDVYRVNKLRAPTAVAPDFHLVFADCMEPPFAKATFDVVLTPWFVDIVPEDPRNLAKRINGLLAPGGLWINFGPLGITNALFSRRYTRPELNEIAIESGFEVRESRVERITYLKTPAAHSFRLEDVIVFSAAKQADCADPGVYRYLPDWLVDYSLPVPLIEPVRLFKLEHDAYNKVGELVDGRRSIVEIAASLAGQLQMTDEQARETLINLFTTLVEKQIFNR